MFIDTLIHAEEKYKTGRRKAKTGINTDTRTRRADRILAVCENFSHRPLEELNCVDLGLSSGGIVSRYAERFKNVTRVVQSSIYKTADTEWFDSQNIDFVCSDRVELALPDNSADVIICNQLYEHVANREALMSEIYRVLKYGGFCYFCARNRYVLFAGPYFFPFLAMVRHKIVNAYCKFTRRKEISEARLLSLGKLRKLTGNFWRHDYTTEFFLHPESYAADDVIRRGNIFSRMPKWILSIVYPFMPAWMWVLTKKK